MPAIAKNKTLSRRDAESNSNHFRDHYKGCIYKSNHHRGNGFCRTGRRTYGLRHRSIKEKLISLLTALLFIHYQSTITFATMPVEIKIINHSSNPEPAYATAGSSGMDIRANLDAPWVLQPFERGLIPTGLFIQLPEGYEAQIRPRSGLAIKHGITCLNTPGTIDSDYRGEIKIILINLSQEEQIIHHGDRIAQMVIQPVELATWKIVNELEATERNAGGFGHTGKK
jgi:dUTP pyrophosphatase